MYRIRANDQLAPAVRDNVRGANAQRVFKL